MLYICKKFKIMKPYPLSPTIGTFPEDKIVGREKDIIRLLRLLLGQSVSIEEIRRMGKTLLVMKLAYWCNNNLLPEEFKNEKFKAKYFTFQGRQNLGELIDYLIKELDGMKEWYQIDLSNTYDFVRKLLNSPKIDFQGGSFSLNLPEFKKSWKEIFYNLLNDIANKQAKDNSKLILIFDELPIMLWEWSKQGNHEDAMEFLDILRERRQMLENKGVRFVYCGSIGIKVVLNKFRKEYSYTGEATNEMEEFNLGPFSIEEVKFLCECYTMSGFNIDKKEKESLWDEIYKVTNGIPYYISKVFNIIQTEFDKIINSETIQKAYDQIINDTNKHKVFNQLIDRINIYYPIGQSEKMKSILTYLSGKNDFIDEDEIVKNTQFDNKSVTQTLYDLMSDHYLIRQIKEEKRTYKFKYEIFRQWWKINIA